MVIQDSFRLPLQHLEVNVKMATANGAENIVEFGANAAAETTLPADGAHDSSRPLPKELLERYEDIRPIGEGSMGTVYRANDPRLGRPVAIKLLKSDDPTDTRRFIREAHAQARVHHDSVCRVHEVGIADGEPYIAMELIDGEPLDILHHRMTLEEKVKVIREVAAALHEAHRLGLIHRDVKPGNIMVVTAQDGSYKPYVVDFGLARDIASTGNSTQNGIAGTPAYMSPEQAEGSSALLDRRSDVYSLGATLYDLIAGRPPFIGPNALAVLTQVMYDDAPALRRIRKGVPVQLETIVMTCLQRDPARRYESARELGDDLQRFLDGARVHAKRPPFTYVLKQKIIRYKALVAVGTVGLCFALTLTGLWIRSAQQAAKQAELARELGEDVKYVELFLRSAYGMPVHDIEREQRVVRRRLINVSRRMEEVGRLGQGPGQYALGRGQLALNEYEEAQKHLELSLASGYDKPEVHYALGLVLSERYQSARNDARRIADAKSREAAIRFAEAKYQEPALLHLRASGGTEVESRTYIEGLVAFLEKRYEEAAEKAIEATAEAPWLYEAKKLEGDARFASGVLESEIGHRDNGYRLLNMAVDAYTAAAAIATSDAIIHEALAETWVQILKLQTWDNLPYQHAFTEAISSCDNATKANPTRSRALAKKSQAYFYAGKYEFLKGNDPRSLFQMAIDAGLGARQITPDDAISLDIVGLVFNNLAKYELKLGRDPIPNFERAVANCDEATRIQPQLAWAWNDGGLALLYRASFEADTGIDPHVSIDSAMTRFHRAQTEDSQYIAPIANEVFVLGIQASYEFSRGKDPRPIVTRAIEVATRGAALDPTWRPLLNNRGWAALVHAQYESAINQDPSLLLAYVESSFQASLDINAEESDTQFGMGAAKHLRAAYQIQKRLDPQKYFDEALKFLEKAMELDSQEPAVRAEFAQLHLTMARHAKSQKKDFAVFLEKADRIVREGLAANARHAPLQSTLAEVISLHAELVPADKLIAEGLSATEEALKLNSKWARALAVQGVLYCVRAGTKQGSGMKNDLDLARESLDKAYAINPLLPDHFKRCVGTP